MHANEFKVCLKRHNISLYIHSLIAGLWAHGCNTALMQSVGTSCIFLLFTVTDMGKFVCILPLKEKNPQWSLK